MSGRHNYMRYLHVTLNDFSESDEDDASGSEDQTQYDQVGSVPDNLQGDPQTVTKPPVVLQVDKAAVVQSHDHILDNPKLASQKTVPKEVRNIISDDDEDEQNVISLREGQHYCTVVSGTSDKKLNFSADQEEKAEETQGQNREHSAAASPKLQVTRKITVLVEETEDIQDQYRRNSAASPQEVLKKLKFYMKTGQFKPTTSEDYSQTRDILAVTADKQNEIMLMALEYAISKSDERLIDVVLPVWKVYGKDTDPGRNPMILAAIENNAKIISYMKATHKDIFDIPKPHDYVCKKRECEKVDLLKHALSRTITYKAMASPAYLLSESDPIESALELRLKMLKLGDLEKEFKTDYLDLASKVEDFTCDLVELCAGESELSMLLDCCYSPESTVEQARKDGAAKKTPELNRAGDMIELCADESQLCVPLDDCNSAPKYERKSLSRVKQAYKDGATKFVALAFVQRHLSDKFYGSSPKQRQFFLNNSNIIKCLAALVLFPVGLLLAIGYIFFGGFHKFSPPRTAEESKESNKWCKMEWYKKLPFYINYLQFPVIKFYIQTTCYVIFLMVLIVSTFHIGQLTSGSIERNTSLSWDQIFILCYIVERYYWDGYDPEIIADCLYAIANVISFARLSYILPAFEELGPLLVVLGKVLVDMLHFMSLLVIVFLAFLIGINNLYMFYGPDMTADGIVANKAFGGVVETFHSLFWAIFGMGDDDNTVLNAEGHYFVQVSGFILYGTFHVITVIMLINMLIAMLSSSFEKTNEKRDTEWKYARTGLWLNYIDDEGETLPVPFNLIPTVKSCVNLVHWIRSKCCHKSSRKSVSNQAEDQEYKKYQKVMKKLKGRYRRTHLIQDNTSPHENIDEEGKTSPEGQFRQMLMFYFKRVKDQLTNSSTN